MVEYRDMTVVIKESSQVEYKHKDGSVKTTTFGSVNLGDGIINGATQVPGGEKYANGGAVKDNPKAGTAFTGSAAKDIVVYINPSTKILKNDSRIDFKKYTMYYEREGKTYTEEKTSPQAIFGIINMVITAAHEAYTHAFLFMFNNYTTETDKEGYIRATYNHNGDKNKTLEDKVKETEKNAEKNYRLHEKYNSKFYKEFSKKNGKN